LRLGFTAFFLALWLGPIPPNGVEWFGPMICSIPLRIPHTEPKKKKRKEILKNIFGQ
jgi:hypothetical protein